MAAPTAPTRFDNIIKPANDNREYRGLILPNKLKVLLVSDPATNKSAASLDVQVGQLNDPKELPGLAHFCEHMLFLGTAKYPETNGFDEFLSKGGGGSNAVTSYDQTLYFFDINPENLEGALDRFSQFFISPLFTESMIEKEINAVHMEYEMDLSDDSSRLDQLDKALANQKHAYAKFGTGNKTTLAPKEKLREALLKFHGDWFSANIMSLCVLGKESLDELEKMVVQKFSDIANKNVDAPEWNEHPFKKEHFQKKWLVVPVKDLRTLSIIFPAPDLRKEYLARPFVYWSHLLGHEGKGSLLSALKEKGWCNKLMAGEKSVAARGFNFFFLETNLTEEGLLHVDDIVYMTFQYINMVKPDERIFNELRDIAKMNFRFSAKGWPQSYVAENTINLHKYPIEEVLSGSRLFDQWKPELIKEIKSYLKPENIRVQVVAKDFEKETDSVEALYGTKYKIQAIKDKLIDKWKIAGTNSAFHLPDENKFVPNKFDIKYHKFPVIIENNEQFRFWFKQDDELLDPKATMTFHFVSSLAYLDPVSRNMTNMFVRLFNDSFNEYAYDASLAGLQWKLDSTKYGLNLNLEGYDQKLDVFLEKILYKMVNFNVDPKRFDVLKEEYIRDLKNTGADEPYERVTLYLDVLLSEQFWDEKELLNACSLLTVERLKQFIPMFMSKMHVECLIYGNVIEPEALEIIKMVKSKFASPFKDSTPLLPRQLVLYRELELRDGCQYVFEIENKLNGNSCTLAYYQTGIRSPKSNVLLDLTAQIIDEPCFNTLRTEEQLGYVVLSDVRRKSGVQGLQVIVQSDKHPQYVEGRIDAFMESMQKLIADMSDDEFNRHKKSLVTDRLEKPKSMSSQSKEYWREINKQQYNFDRDNTEVAYIQSITKQQILDFYKDFTQRDSPGRRKLCIHIVSTAEGGAGTQQNASEHGAEESKAVRINDILQFKTSHSLHALVQPFNNVPRKGTQQQ